MQAIVNQDYYYHYRFEVSPTPTGNIVKVWRASKFGDRSLQYVGSYFSLSRRIPVHACYNAGQNYRYESLRESGEEAIF